jgi:DNA-directed RNA polymerase subunit M/transcription elongation factor TFIIS
MAEFWFKTGTNQASRFVNESLRRCKHCEEAVWIKVGRVASEGEINMMPCPNCGETHEVEYRGPRKGWSNEPMSNFFSTNFKKGENYVPQHLLPQSLKGQKKIK